MDKLKSKIIEMVNSAGYDYAVNIGFWNGYEVYEPIYWADGIYNEDLHEFILAKDEEIRWTNSSEEAFKVINEMEKYETNELENEPIKLEPNLTMKSFKFECGGYMGCDIFEYKSLKKGNFLTYNEKGCGSLDIKPSKIKIEDAKFDEFALGMIKYFYKDLGTDTDICDGEWFEFRATLSNGQKLKSTGYNYFPFTYYKFVAYLGHYWK